MRPAVFWQKLSKIKPRTVIFVFGPHEASDCLRCWIAQSTVCLKTIMEGVWSCQQRQQKPQTLRSITEKATHEVFWNSLRASPLLLRKLAPGKRAKIIAKLGIRIKLLQRGKKWKKGFRMETRTHHFLTANKCHTFKHKRASWRSVHSTSHLEAFYWTR